LLNHRRQYTRPIQPRPRRGTRDSRSNEARKAMKRTPLRYEGLGGSSLSVVMWPFLTPFAYPVRAMVVEVFVFGLCLSKRSAHKTTMPSRICRVALTVPATASLRQLCTEFWVTPYSLTTPRRTRPSGGAQRDTGKHRSLASCIAIQVRCELLVNEIRELL
jgi:hypothetical protein